MTKLSIWERTGILYGNKKPKHHKLGEHKIKQYTPNTSKLNKIDCRDVIKQLNTLNYNDVDSKIDDICDLPIASRSGYWEQVVRVANNNTKYN